MQIEKLLNQTGLRVTKQRKAVLELLIKRGEPLSHAEITSLLEEPLDKVTLYRTLETLLSVNIVHRVQGPDGVWRFCAHDREAEGCPGDHPHFLCLECGRMMCIVNQRMARVKVPDGCEVKGKQMVVYGLCPRCAAEKKEHQQSEDNLNPR